MRLFTVLAILSVIAFSIPDFIAAQIVLGSGCSEPLYLSNAIGASQDVKLSVRPSFNGIFICVLNLRSWTQ